MSNPNESRPSSCGEFIFSLLSENANLANELAVTTLKTTSSRLADLKTAEDEPPGDDYKLVPIKVGPDQSFSIITQEEADEIEMANNDDTPPPSGSIGYDQYEWSSATDDSDYDEYSERKGNRKPRLKHRTRQRIAANKRERSRMKVINKGFERLRKVVPYARNDRRHSKVETLRLAIEYIRNLDSLLNDNGANSHDLDRQQNIIVYYTPTGATHTEAIPHSLSWVKEPQMTASCFPDILPTDRNGTSQPQKIRARIWYPALSDRSFSKGTVPIELIRTEHTTVDWGEIPESTVKS